MGFSTSIWIEGNQGASLPWNLGRLRAFSILILSCDDQGTSLHRSKWKVTKGFSTSKPKRLRGIFISIFQWWQSKGFSTSIWMEGNQGASLPWNLGWLRGFSISILNCDDQRASLPQFGWKETNGLLYIGTWGFAIIVVCSCWNFEHCMPWLEILVWSCCNLGIGAF